MRRTYPLTHPKHYYPPTHLPTHPPTHLFSSSFQIFGKHAAHTSVMWIDDTGAFAVVTVDDLKDEDILGALATMPKGVRLTTFARWYQHKASSSGGEEEDDPTGALSWIMKRTLTLLGWGGREGEANKRLRVS